MSSVHDQMFEATASPLLRTHFGEAATYDGQDVTAAVEAEQIVDEDDGRRRKRQYRRTATVYIVEGGPTEFYPDKAFVYEGVTYRVHEVVAVSAGAAVLDVRRAPATEVHGQDFRNRR